MSDNDTVTPQASPPPAPLSNDERTWALIGHLAAFSAFITGIGCVIGPLVVWLVKRDTLPFASEQAKEALNFNITVALAFVALFVFTLLTFGIGILLAWPIGVALFVAWFVLTIVAALKANEGVAYRYPFTLRLVK
ncbi:MAG: DUF4870 domain-containing protein [Rhodanobacteraceae bacterium]|jgi:hypothetical protein|nr:DUF4870 domain-containing protein [Rhodanobacteraceae bacterium]